MRVCCGCGKNKPVSDYTIRGNRKSGIVSRCKDCKNEATREWYTKNTDKAKLDSRKVS